jgi:hypothetical protein
MEHEPTSGPHVSLLYLLVKVLLFAAKTPSFAIARPVTAEEEFQLLGRGSNKWPLLSSLFGASMITYSNTRKGEDYG